MKCLVNMTESHASTESALLKWTTPGEMCNFSVVSLDGIFGNVDCVREEGQGNAHTCEIRSLQPGTVYHLEIMSKTGGGRVNVSLQTGRTPLNLKRKEQALFNRKPFNAAMLFLFSNVGLTRC